MGKLWQREFEHQLPELEEKICSRAGNQILSCCNPGKYLPYKSILPTGTQKGIMKNVCVFASRVTPLLHRSHNLAFGYPTIWCSQKMAVTNESIAKSCDSHIYCFLKTPVPRCRSSTSVEMKPSLQLSELYKI